MRKKIVAGNWKMNTTLAEGVGLAKDVNEALKKATPKCDVVICVPFTHLASVNAVIDSNISASELKTVPTRPRVHIPARCLVPWSPLQELLT